MASPQLEKGHTRIANEILEVIAKTNLNGTQFRIVTILWRYTYGFHRKKYEMPLSFIAEKTGTSKSHVDRELKSLIERKIVTVVGVGPRRGRILTFNKNYKEWLPADKKKQELPKEQPKPKKSKKPKVYDENNTYYKMALYFHGLVSNVAREAGVEHLIRKANLQSWADDFRKLVEIDGVSKRLAKDVMDWVTQDPFWRTNVLSARKLREKFSELAIKMNAAKKPTKPPRQAPKKDIRDKEIEFQRFLAAGGNPDEFDWSL